MKGLNNTTIVAIILLSTILMLSAVQALNYMYASEIINGTFGNQTGGGDYTFPEDLFVRGDLYMNTTSSCINMPNGGTVCGNETCITIYSPDGGSIVESCN